MSAAALASAAGDRVAGSLVVAIIQKLTNKCYEFNKFNLYHFQHVEIGSQSWRPFKSFRLSKMLDHSTVVPLYDHTIVTQLRVYYPESASAVAYKLHSTPTYESPRDAAASPLQADSE